MPVRTWPWEKTLAVLGLLLVLLLQGWAILGQSLTSDEPYHLAAGYQALEYGRNTLNLEHPPLVKLVAALPFLVEGGFSAPPAAVDRASSASRRVFATPSLARRIQVRSRSLLLLVFVLPGLVAWFLVGEKVAGRRAALVLVLLVGLSFSVLPYLSLVHTDAAETIGFALTVLGGLELLERPGAAAATTAGLGLGLGLAAKYSGVLLLPPLALAVTLSPREGSGRWLRRLGAFAASSLLGFAFLTAVYAAANRDYDVVVGRETIASYAENRGTLVVDREMLDDEPLLLHLEACCPLTAQWWTGFVGLHRQDSIGVYPSYVLGDLTSQGRWWYFPTVFLLKTPLLVLACTLLAIVARLRCGFSGFPRLRRWRVHLFLAFTVVQYLAVAMTSNYNIGFRHLLPILPLLFLPAAAWLGDRPRWAVAAVAVLAVEALVLAPNWMVATNTWWLGKANPTRFAFGGGDGDWEQGLVRLGQVTRNCGIERLHVVSPLATPDEVHVWLGDARVTTPGEPVGAGWYAVSVILEQDLPAIASSSPASLHSWSRFQAIARAWRPLVERICRGEDHGYVAGVFHLYRVVRAAPGAS